MNRIPVLRRGGGKASDLTDLGQHRQSGRGLCGAAAGHHVRAEMRNVPFPIVREYLRIDCCPPTLDPRSTRSCGCTGQYSQTNIIVHCSLFLDHRTFLYYSTSDFSSHCGFGSQKTCPVAVTATSLEPWRGWSGRVTRCLTTSWTSGRRLCADVKLWSREANRSLEGSIDRALRSSELVPRLRELIAKHRRVARFPSS